MTEAAARYDGHTAKSFQVKVGHQNLVGEVIRINADQATIQVYEETGTCLPAHGSCGEGT